MEATKLAPKRQRSSNGAGSFGLTHVDTQGWGDVEEVPEFEKFTVAQKEFWDTYTLSYLFGMQTLSVHISQCQIANDEYIIQKMESKIVKSMKVELVQIENINQWQKICLTPIDKHWRLLQTKLKDWNEIMNKKFIIINNQHSIVASKELQFEGCSEDRQQVLQKWDAYIIWDLDPVRFTKISKFYNSTNHLNHAQPTWGNQIVSGKNI